MWKLNTAVSPETLKKCTCSTYELQLSAIRRREEQDVFNEQIEVEHTIHRL